MLRPSEYGVLTTSMSERTAMVMISGARHGPTLSSAPPTNNKGLGFGWIPVLLYSLLVALLTCYDWRPPKAFSYHRFFWPEDGLFQVGGMMGIPTVIFLILMGTWLVGNHSTEHNLGQAATISIGIAVPIIVFANVFGLMNSLML
jgi:hypothetical protein